MTIALTNLQIHKSINNGRQSHYSLNAYQHQLTLIVNRPIAQSRKFDGDVIIQLYVNLAPIKSNDVRSRKSIEQA